jgi:hypothetical protein
MTSIRVQLMRLEKKQRFSQLVRNGAPLRQPHR